MLLGIHCLRLTEKGPATVHSPSFEDAHHHGYDATKEKKFFVLGAFQRHTMCVHCLLLQRVSVVDSNVDGIVRLAIVQQSAYQCYCHCHCTAATASAIAIATTPTMSQFEVLAYLLHNFCRQPPNEEVPCHELIAKDKRSLWGRFLCRLVTKIEPLGLLSCKS